jgi:hypothetical protein
MRALGAGTAAFALLVATATGAAPRAGADSPPECKVKIGAPEQQTQPTQPWELKRLSVEQIWPITDGAGVLVAVIDSGFDRDRPQLSHIKVRQGVNVSGAFGPTDTRDCFFHGTAVTGIIAAPPVNGVYFTGVAPGVTIMPIKEQQGDVQQGTNHIAEAIDAAIAAHARVVNISITTPVPTPDLERAVAAAARADIVMVAAGGNDLNGSNAPAYPAAYSTRYPNVLAVSMTDQNDAVGGISTQGSYIDIAAPGNGVELPMPKGTYRIEATADAPPGVTVPSPAYGYGIVNPYLAVTAVRGDAVAPQPKADAQPIAAVPPRPPADRHPQHLALWVGIALLGLAVVAGLVAAVVRRGAWLAGHPAPPSAE